MYSNVGSLLSLLNTIFVAGIVFCAIRKFSSYKLNVTIYAIAKTIIPMITSFFLSKLLGTDVAFSLIGTVLLLVVYFLQGLLVVKLIEKIVDYFNYDTFLFFVVSFSIIDFIVSLASGLVLSLIIR